MTDEETEFNLEGNHDAFWVPGDYNTNEFTPNHTKLSVVDASNQNYTQPIHAMVFYDNNAMQTPLMLKTKDGLYINIHEAGLINYPAVQLTLDKKEFILNTHLVPSAVGDKA